MRKITVIVVPLIFLACGSHTTPAAPSPAALDLVPGAYALTLTLSQTGDPSCTGSICTSISVCVGDSGASAVRTLATIVRLDRSGDAVTIRPDDSSASFRLDLQVSGTVVGGTAAGQFRDGALQISVEPGGGAQSSAVATGTVLATSVVGKINGDVAIGGFSCSNNGHTWTLSPRRP